MTNRRGHCCPLVPNEGTIRRFQADYTHRPVLRPPKPHAGEGGLATQVWLVKPPKDFGKIDFREFDPENYRGVGPK